MWDTIHDDDVTLGGLALNNAVRHHSRYVCDILAGWDDTEDMEVISGYSLSSGSTEYADQFPGKGKTIIVGGAIASTDRINFDKAYQELLGTVRPNAPLVLERTTPSGPRRMNVRLAGQITKTDDHGNGARYSIPLVATDPLKYGPSLYNGTGIAKPGQYGRQYPFRYPKLYNVFANTSFTKLRYNRAANPSGEVGTHGWDVYSNGTPQSTLSNPTISTSRLENGGAKVVKCIWGAADDDGGLIYRLEAGSTIPGDFFVTGKEYTFSIYARREGTNNPSQFYFSLDWYTAGGETFLTTGGYSHLPEDVNLPYYTDEQPWHRFYFSSQVPAGADFGYLVVYRKVPNSLVNEALAVDGLLIEDGPPPADGSEPPQYFDGDTSGAFWDGPAHSSSSTRWDVEPIAGTQVQETMTVVNEGTWTTYPISRVLGPLPSGWYILNETTEQYLTFDFPVADGTEVVIDHRRESALANGYPIEYSYRGSWWGLEPGENILRLTSPTYNNEARWDIEARPAWR